MSVDRHTTLRRAEQFVRQGRHALAVDEYLRVLAERPGDWSTANALGDLYVRQQEHGRAVEQFLRGADALLVDGFAARAAALYRKALRFDPDNAYARARLTEASAEPHAAPLRDTPRTDLMERGDVTRPGGDDGHVAGEAPRVAEEAARPEVPADPHAIRVEEIETVPDLQFEVVGLEAPPSPPPLEDIFAGFREEAAMEASGDTAEVSLARGRTLQAAGRIDEAIRDLQWAARAPQVRFEAASALARIYRDQGLLSEAVEWFERAAEAPAPGDAESHRLLYELGLSLEAAGEHARALAVYLELQIAAGTYADAAERVQRLETAGGEE